MADAVVLQHMQALADVRIDDGLVLAIGELRRVAMRHDDEDAGCAFCRNGVDGSDAAFRHRAAHDRTIHMARYVELRGVACAPGDLLSAVDAADRLPDESGCHARAPAVSTARTMARCMSSILKSLCPRPCAPCAASAAARRSAAGSRSDPASAASTRGTRHGLVPTPPSATRACRIRAPSMSSATAADTTANSNEARSRTLR